MTKKVIAPVLVGVIVAVMLAGGIYLFVVEPARESYSLPDQTMTAKDANAIAKDLGCPENAVTGELVKDWAKRLSACLGEQLRGVRQ